MAKLTRVADTSEIEPGQGKVVEAEGKTLAVFNCDGTFYAIDNTCLHRGGPLGEGDLEGTIVTCPWHGWRYEVTTGANAMNAAIKVASFPVTVEGTSVLVEL
ncbi:MAG TPA: Rieske 2Fe-2S domain-containing protein [Methylomirabilota bacterium]|jgi:nitrite reductase/ring-hydroxylating ferredoxin subunit|nr:Rieske 2Fe-2S domain-containing protein [Methylomirabilota bacterium]